MQIKKDVCPRMVTFRPPRIAISLLLFAAAAQFVAPADWVDLGSLPAAAAVIGLTGFLLMIRAWWLFKIRDNAICPTADTATLITDDVYRLTRNPMYLGIVMMLVSVGLFAASIFYFLAAAIFFLIINHSFCPYEEHKLRLIFGEHFTSYAKTVRRWL